MIPRKKDHIEVEKSTVYIAIIYGISSSIMLTFWQYNIFAALVALVASLIGIKYFHRKEDNIAFFISFFVGPLSEISAVYAGVWSYSAPFAQGIPLWLPFLWGQVVVVTLRSTKVLAKL